MTFSFSQSSLDHLKGVHPNLVNVIYKALSYGVSDFSVGQGVRTQAYQDALYAQGRDGKPGKIVTWTKESKHLIQADGYGHAVDLNPLPIDFNNILSYKKLSNLMLSAAAELKVPIVWGGEFKNKDWGHYELAGEG